KKLSVPSGTLKQWEKDLDGLLVIPRSKQGARFYTDYEINLLKTVKQMRDKNLSQKMIRELMGKYLENSSEIGSETLETSLMPVSSEETSEKNSGQDIEKFMAAMESFKDRLIMDV